MKTERLPRLARVARRLRARPPRRRRAGRPRGAPRGLRRVPRRAGLAGPASPSCSRIADPARFEPAPQPAGRARASGSRRRSRPSGSASSAGAGAAFGFGLGGALRRGRRGAARSSSFRRRQRANARAARRLRLAAAGDEDRRDAEPHAFGTEIHMYVQGVRSGTLCRVFLRGADGARISAGTFRYRWGDDSERCSARPSTSPGPSDRGPRRRPHLRRAGRERADD